MLNSFKIPQTIQSYRNEGNKAFYIFLSLILFCCAKKNIGQNLVRNSSFEDYVSCPFLYYGQMDLANGWSAFRNSPDYAHVCAGSVPGVPGGHYQVPVTGNAYGAFVAYTSFQNGEYREHIGSKLCDSLIIGHKYYVSINVVHAEGSLGYCNKIGVKFSTIPFSNLTIHPPLTNNAHIYSNNIINDDINWTKIDGSFIADSSYKYIIIGNFFDSANTTHDDDNAYYLLDDICVSEDSLTCFSSVPPKFLGNDTTLCFGETLILNATTKNSNYLWQDNSTNSTYNVSQSGTYWVKVESNNCSNKIDSININYNQLYIVDLPNIFTPNNDGVNDILMIETCSDLLKTTIYNRWGNKVFETEKINYYWDGRTASDEKCIDGNYFYVIETKEKTYKGFIQLIR